MRRLALISLSACLALPAAAFADSITVYGTGLGTPGGSDPNYTLVSAPIGGFTSGPAVIIDPTTYPGWNSGLPITTGGGYIGVTANGGAAEPTGFTGSGNTPYVYKTTFTIGSNENPSSAILDVALEADDTSNIYLNGHEVVLYGSYTELGNYFGLLDFDITSGFVSGVNTLDFDVLNLGGGPTGLYTAISGTVSPSPEPSSIALLGTGLLSLGGLVRRKLRS